MIAAVGAAGNPDQTILFANSARSQTAAAEKELLGAITLLGELGLPSISVNGVGSVCGFVICQVPKDILVQSAVSPLGPLAPWSPGAFSQSPPTAEANLVGLPGKLGPAGS